MIKNSKTTRNAKKVLAAVMTGVMFTAGIGLIPAATAEARETAVEEAATADIKPVITEQVGSNYTGSFTSYIAFGADAYDLGDWSYAYSSEDYVYGDVYQTPVTAWVGDTFTISVSVASETVYTWYIAPVLVANQLEGEEIIDLQYDMSLKIDGKSVNIDFSAGDLWWYEETGDYYDAIRLAGGYNEWGAQYIDSPVFTTVEYTITITSATVGYGEDEYAWLPDSPDYDIITDFPAYITNYGRADYYFPDAVYTVQNDVMTVTMNIAYLRYGTDAYGNTYDGGFNDWCSNGVVVTLSDGTKKYYAFGGAQATWDISIEGPETYEIWGGANNPDNSYTILNDEGKGSINFVVDKGTTIAIYALGWDNYDGDLFEVSFEGDEVDDPSDYIYDLFWDLVDRLSLMKYSLESVRELSLW